MAPLDNIKHEKFCHFIARGNDPVVAFVGAGFPRIPAAAVVFLCQPKIIARIEEILPHYLKTYPNDDGPRKVPSLIQRLVDARKDVNIAFKKAHNNANPR